MLLLAGCAAHNTARQPAIVDAPPSDTAIAKNQPPQSVITLLSSGLQPMAMAISPKIEENAGLCKTKGAQSWGCWLLMPDHTYGYAGFAIVSEIGGGAHLVVTYRAVGSWKE